MHGLSRLNLDLFLCEGSLYRHNFQMLLHSTCIFITCSQKTKLLIALTAGFGIWGVRSHAHASAHALNVRDMLKKARLVWLKKIQGVRQIARLKQQRFLSFTFYITQRSYEKIMCIYLLFDWFSGGNYIVFTFSLNKGR